MVGWFLLLAVVCAAFAVLHASVLPKYILKYRYKSVPVGRGLTAMRDARGESIVYEPDAVTGRFVLRYILSDRDGKKRLICRIDESIGSLDYDVALYNGKGKLFKVLRVKEKIIKPGYTSEVGLPDRTVYAAVFVNSADAQVVSRAPYRVSAGRFLLFLTLCILTEAAGFFVVYVCIAHLFGGIYTESCLIDPNCYAIADAILLFIIFALVNISVTFAAVKKCNPAKAGKGKRNAGL